MRDMNMRRTEKWEVGISRNGKCGTKMQAARLTNAKLLLGISTAVHTFRLPLSSPAFLPSAVLCRILGPAFCTPCRFVLHYPVLHFTRAFSASPYRIAVSYGSKGQVLKSK